MKPKISVIISTYNRSQKFLPKAIESVQDQSFQDWELIVVDDHSTDDTEGYCKGLKDKRIRYHRLKKNSGSDPKPKNTGIGLAKAELIAFLDDDVQYRRHALRTLYKAITDDLDVVYGDMWIKPNNEPGIAYDFDAQLLMLRNYIDTSVALVRKAALYDVGGWDESLPKFVDWNLWVRLAKAGYKFKRINKYVTNYYIHEESKSQRVKTEMYNHPSLGKLFVPTFSPSGCDIDVGYIGEQRDPKVAVFTIHYNRPEYSKQTYKEMDATAGYPFTKFQHDNSKKNIGITKASNKLIDEIMADGSYDIIIKIDNDVEFDTYGWLKDIVSLWKKNRMLYVSPYVEGLYHFPGGSSRIGYGMIGDEFVEVTRHIGGIFAAIDAKAYLNFRWTDEMLHGNQDREASDYFRKHSYMPCYYPRHRIAHRDTTSGQWEKYPDYFKDRKKERGTKA